MQNRQIYWHIVVLAVSDDVLVTQCIIYEAVLLQFYGGSQPNLSTQQNFFNLAEE